MQCHWDSVDYLERQKILRNAGFGGLGRISYSLKLWRKLPKHVQTRIDEGARPDPGERTQK